MGVISLPLDLAIREAAKQNFLRDVKMKLRVLKDWESMKDTYEKEANELLTTTGENYEPEFGEDQIVVHKESSTE